MPLDPQPSSIYKHKLSWMLVIYSKIIDIELFLIKNFLKAFLKVNYIGSFTYYLVFKNKYHYWIWTPFGEGYPFLSVNVFTTDKI